MRLKFFMFFILFYAIAGYATALNPVTEYVYLSTDKSFYAEGDKIYFKAAVLDAASKAPLVSSELLHVVLLDHGKNIVWKGKYTIDQATAAGTIDVNNDMEGNVGTGRFYLAATTINSSLRQNTIVPIEIVADLRPRFVSTEQFNVADNDRDVLLNVEVKDQFSNIKEDIKVKMMIAKKSGYPRIMIERTDPLGRVDFKIKNYKKYDFDRVEFIFLQDDLSSTKVVHRNDPSPSNVDVFYRTDKTSYLNNNLEFKATDRWGKFYSETLYLLDDNSMTIDSIIPKNGFYSLSQELLINDSITLEIDKIPFSLSNDHFNPRGLNVTQERDGAIRVFMDSTFRIQEKLNATWYYKGQPYFMEVIDPLDQTEIFLIHKPYMKWGYLRIEDLDGNLAGQYPLRINENVKDKAPKKVVEVVPKQILDLKEVFDWKFMQDGDRKYAVEVRRLQFYDKSNRTSQMIAINEPELDGLYPVGKDLLNVIKAQKADGLEIHHDDFIRLQTWNDPTRSIKSVKPQVEINFLGNKAIERVVTDKRGVAYIDPSYLQMLGDNKILLPISIAEETTVEVSDFHVYLDEMILEESLELISHHDFEFDERLLDKTYREFMLKRGQLDQINLDAKVYYDKPEPIKWDYVCSYNILNCPNHKSGRRAIHNEVYWVYDGFSTFQPQFYVDPNYQKDKKFFTQITGVKSLQAYDNLALEELSDSFYDQRGTIYWQPYEVYRKKGLKTKKIKIPDVPGNYQATLSWFDVNGNSGVQHTLIKVSK